MLPVPGYEILGVLHRTRRSTLVRARRIATGESMVLKALVPEQSTPRDAAVLRHEYEVLRSLELPGVLRAYELIQQGAQSTLVLEDFGAISLRDLAVGTQLTPATVLRLGARVAEALGELHRRGLLHGDIKAHNVLVSPDLKTLKLADFGSSTQLARQAQEAISPGSLRGTLAYMAPEQTGRVNQSIDERSDLYSLGVTLFELLTQQLPFGSSDPLGVVHGHIARKPPRVDDLVPGLPRRVGDLVDRLLAKAAEDRYQSASGLRYDLIECARRMEEGGPVELELGRRDRPLRLEPPQKLYGREAELKTLLSGWERVAGGRAVLVLVSGSSGIGKTALVSEVQKPLTSRRGYFVSGKCDQVKRDVPYGAAAQALGALFRQLLAESNEEVQGHREALMKAWGTGARAFIDLVPEVEKLTGPQPPLPPLGPSEAQNRLLTLFDRFLQAFSERGRPLVFFLDDLQWADSGTLTLLERQLAQPEPRAWLVIGAYRDNEVDASHPLARTIEAVKKGGAGVEEIRLGPLPSPSLRQFVADALRAPPERCVDLAELVLQKTGGNPFFVGQFLRTLREEGLLEFDPERGEWAYDLARVRAARITDNVVELLLGKLQRLPAATQAALQVAACVGNRFDLSALSLLSGQPEPELRAALAPAVREGFLLALRGEGDDPVLGPQAMRFQHDRVQQAAYGLLPPSERAQVHLRLARRMRPLAAGGSGEAHLLDVAEQYSLGVEGLSDPQERVEAAELLLEAARLAKAATAYGPARRYAGLSLVLLGDDAEQRHHEVWSQAATEHAEAEYLCNHFDAAEAAYESLIERLRTPLGRALVILKKMLLYVTLGRNWDVLALARRGFELLGRTLPDFRDKAATTEAMKAEFALVEALLEGHRQRFEQRGVGRPFRLDDLLDLPACDAPEQRALLELMVSAIPPAYFFGEEIFKLVILKMVSLTLENGAVDASSFGYVLFAHVLASERKEYRSGLAFGHLGMALAERFRSMPYIGKTNYMMGAFVNHWGRHISTSLPYLERGHRLCVEAGELVWGGYAGSLYIWTFEARGAPLPDLLAESSKHVAFARRTQHDDIVWDALLPLRMARALQGLTDAPGSFSGDGFDEPREVATMEGLEKKLPINLYLILKARTLFLLGHLDEALALSLRADQTIWVFAGMVVFTRHQFFHGLILAATSARGPGPQGDEARTRLGQLIEQFAIWADACPANFRHCWLLLRAEQARLAGDIAALTLYDEAIEAAHEGGFVQDEAVACELAARYHIGARRARFARTYVTDAWTCYRAWGASAKLRLLEQQHPQLQSMLQTSVDTTLSEPSSRASNDGLSSFLDQQALLRALQAISSEIVRPRLLQSLLEVVLQTAGARRAVLLVEADGNLVVEAELDLERSAEAHLRPLAASAASLPVGLLQYALRVNEDVVLADSRSANPFADDPYLARHSSRSLLCAHLRRGGRRAGLLYLENDLARGVFTHERLAALRLLGAQATIALDNAELYARLERHNQELEQMVTERTREVSVRNSELQLTLGKVVESQQHLASELGEAAAYVRSLLPAPLDGPVSARWVFLPSAELGGDAFGYQWLDRRRLAVYLLDVCGHGMASALLSISVLSALQSRHLGADFHDPGSVLSALNTAFPSSAHNGLYFTLWYGVLDLDDGSLAFASAGHPPALLLAPGAEPAELGTDGLMLGILPAVPFPSRRVALVPGSSVLIFSDGAYELVQPSGALLRYEDFVAEVGRPRQPGEALPERMLRFARRTRSRDAFDDDFSMLELCFQDTVPGL